jgi:hypothetical protein
MNSRREFLKRLSVSTGVGLAATTGLYSLDSLSASLSGYKALIVVHLNGGNDSNDFLVPMDQFLAIIWGIAWELTKLPLPCWIYSIRAGLPLWSTQVLWLNRQRSLRYSTEPQQFRLFYIPILSKLNMYKVGWETKTQVVGVAVQWKHLEALLL